MSISETSPWRETIKTYAVPPIAAGFSIIPAFKYMVIKSAQQTEAPIPRMTTWQWAALGVKAAPATGALVGGQMIAQKFLERTLFTGEPTVASTVASSALVGAGTSPLLIYFNGRTLHLNLRQSFQRASPALVGAIVVGETCFVGGNSLATKVTAVMKKKVGDNKVVEIISTYVSGALGCALGHGPNTLLTRLQNGQRINSFSQLRLGFLSRTHAGGIFALGYKFANDLMKK